jgi:hypothetical protein
MNKNWLMNASAPPPVKSILLREAVELLRQVR